MSRTLTIFVTSLMVALSALPAAAQNSFDLTRPGSEPNRVVVGAVLNNATRSNPTNLRPARDVQPVRGLAASIASLTQLDRRVPAARSDRKTSIALHALYGTYGVLQALDIQSTLGALRSGAHEANPLLGSTAASPWASTAVKAASTAGTLYFVNRMAKRHRKAAIITMVAVNIATAAVVARNVSLARRGR